jgi:hypothetical protein
MFIWRVFRRLLAQVIRLLLLNRAVTVGLVAVLVVGFVVMPLLSRPGGLQGGLSSNGALANGQPVQAASAATGAQAPAGSPTQTLPPDPAVQTYLRGMMAFDANTMWTSLNPQFRTQLEGQGMTLDTMKTQEAQKVNSGITYDKIYYIGSFQGNSGLRYYFYGVTLAGKDSSGQDVNSEIAYTFTVAPDGSGIVDIGAK